ncbi:hypothetical protein RCL1_002294 [Eukaryota sp. TZLM3-RCL]
MPKAETKDQYLKRFAEHLVTYSKVMIVGLDNVTSHQIQRIRMGLRGKAVMVCGKNTQIKVAFKTASKKRPAINKLVPYVAGNVGFIFTEHDLTEVRDIIASNKISAPARVGVIAPDDVHVPAGPTGLEPTQTSFLQALNIATKIAKGQVEIINDVHLIKKGTKVGNSEVQLLQKLNVKPFFYGMEILNILDGESVYSAEVLDITKTDILGWITEGIANVAAVSLALGIPNQASIPHMIINGVKDLLAVAVETTISFPEADEIKSRLA